MQKRDHRLPKVVGVCELPLSVRIHRRTATRNPGNRHSEECWELGNRRWARWDSSLTSWLSTSLAGVLRLSRSANMGPSSCSKTKYGGRRNARFWTRSRSHHRSWPIPVSLECPREIRSELF